MIDGDDPSQTALGLRIATAGGWAAAANYARRNLRHADASVRIAAAGLIGASGQPSMAGELRQLLRDGDEAVVAAAQAALDKLRG